MLKDEYGYSLNTVLDAMRPALQGFATAICAECGVKDIQPHEWRHLEAAMQAHIVNAVRDWATQLEVQREKEQLA